MMKINWRGEAAAALAAFTLTGVAMWGSIISVQAVPMLPNQSRPQIAVVAPGPAVANLIRANLIREGDYA